MPSSVDRPARWVVPALIAAAALLRFHHIDLPFVEPYNSLTRQSIVASVARNFYEHGFRFFYPEINENGAGPYLYNAEMPFYSYAMAIGYWLAGGVREWAARAVSVVCFFGGAAFLWRLTVRTAGARAAAAGMAILVFAPWWVAISRSIQPEATLFFATAGTVAAFYEWVTGGRRRWLLLSVALSFLAVATKITSLYLIAPIAALALLENGRRKRAEAWTAVGLWTIAALLPLIWYAAMMKAGAEQTLAFEPYKLSKKLHQFAGQNIWQIIFSAASLHPVKVFLIHAMMPVGVLGLMAGIVNFFQKKLPLWIGVWLAAGAGSCLLLWRAVVPHPYYLLPVFVPAVLTAGAGLVTVADYLLKSWSAAARWAVFAAVLVTHAALAGHLYEGLYNVPKRSQDIVTAGKAVEQITAPQALVVAYVDGGSPILLYYSHRRGWRFNMLGEDEERMIRDLEGMIRSGARYFATTAIPELGRLKTFEAYLRGRHRVVEDKPEYLIVQLDAAAGRPENTGNSE